ncbi:HAD family phosphatase [uncultured Duncaniella sp.]|jgi:putative hydrolase of the HAD superfamily|uniref:HAD family hydrolase n=1 Tax=uncultured Duncaniella sp. TaxID=2768039 RepID=UPI0026F047F6|nr:HAD family phosphatase [uncultured Duncaniella sp.]
MKSVKNIVIDLGGVMIDLDRERCVRAFVDLGLENADSMLGLYRQEEPFLSIETGRISAGEFYDEIRRRTGRDVSDSAIEGAFDEFLVALPVERLAAIRKLRAAGYRTYMISNTNGVMYDGWIKRAFMQEGLRVGDYFDGIITSFAEGVCKPDAELFETVLRRYGLKAEESVLLDDSEANCEAARRLGMKAVRIIGDMTFTRFAADAV